MDRTSALVTVKWLLAHLDDPSVRVTDVRWFLPSTGRSAHAEFQQGHVPGATFVDLDRELAAHGAKTGGRHPLPNPAAFAEALGRHGIGLTTHVIAYDDSAGSTAARLWWMLRQIGHENVSVLDGGLSAWREAGYVLELGDARVRDATTYPARVFGGFGGIVAREAILSALETGAILIDARAPERFEGTVEPIDPRAGHIPGARNLPFLGNVTASSEGVSTFLSPQLLHRRFTSAGVMAGSHVILSCGSGVTACHNALAMYVAGFEPPDVYVGSWSDWSKHPDMPIETGRSVADDG
jgi:thiosulfate/3-mercaptopyruvate sulfurtransferase